MNETQYGVQYPNGEIDWSVNQHFGSIDTPERRSSFKEQYQLRLASVGVTADVPLVFLTREKVVTYSGEQIIANPYQVPEVEAPAEDTPEEEPPVEEATIPED